MCVEGRGSSIVQTKGTGRLKMLGSGQERGCIGCVYPTQAERVFPEGHEGRPRPHQDSCTSNIPSQPASPAVLLKTAS